MSDQPPFAYRLDHYDGASTTTLARVPSYAAAVGFVEQWATALRAAGVLGTILVVEEAFGTVVARCPLDPGGGPFDPGHRSRAGDPA
jgi:hypothetical protein